MDAEWQVDGECTDSLGFPLTIPCTYHGAQIQWTGRVDMRMSIGREEMGKKTRRKKEVVSLWASTSNPVTWSRFPSPENATTIIAKTLSYPAC